MGLLLRTSKSRLSSRCRGFYGYEFDHYFIIWYRFRGCQWAEIDPKIIFMKKRWIVISIVVLITAGVCSFWYFIGKNRLMSKIPIKVGILHSLTGTMAFSEKAVADMTLLAIEELNESGGLLGRKIEALLVDGRSDWPTFAKEAEKLITVEQVSVVFGCWTSASRKTVKPVFEKYDHLLFYPVQYEGLEQSPNIIYTGAAPNQQIIPAVMWCFENLGKKFFLIGSDYIFPRVANEIIQDHAKAVGAVIVGEEYLMLGSHDVDDVIRKIKEAKPDVILNTINVTAMFHSLRGCRVPVSRLMLYRSCHSVLPKMNSNLWDLKTWWGTMHAGTTFKA